MKQVLFYFFIIFFSFLNNTRGPGSNIDLIYLFNLFGFGGTPCVPFLQKFISITEINYEFRASICIHGQVFAKKWDKSEKTHASLTEIKIATCSSRERKRERSWTPRTSGHVP